MWGLATLLFLLTLSLYILGRTSWPWIALLGVLLSQVLLIISWTDARHGTWLNLVILLVAIVALAKNNFDKKVSAEVATLYRTQEGIEKVAVTPAAVAKYPPVVERWLSRSGAMDFRNVEAVYLKQKGKMRTKPEGNWMPFKAEQWFSVKEPGFVWKTRVKMSGPLYLSGRDTFISGKGSMDISLSSLIPLIRATGDPKIDQASGIRYLAEICWFPTAGLEEYLIWEPQGANTAKAIFKPNPEISGVFAFDEDGNTVSFEAMRYRGSGGNGYLEKWMVRNSSHQNLGGLSIPEKSEVYWATADGEFHWLSLEITEIKYN